MPVTVLGVGSNVIVRDGGIRGVVIRLMGRYWGEVEALDGISLSARAGALDLSVARAAAETHSWAGISLGHSRLGWRGNADECRMLWQGIARCACGVTWVSP